MKSTGDRLESPDIGSADPPARLDGFASRCPLSPTLPAAAILTMNGPCIRDADDRRGGLLPRRSFFDPRLTKRRPERSGDPTRPTERKRQEMFAVIKTGGKQYRVAADDVLKIEKIAGEVGDMIEIAEVLAHGEGEDVTIGAPLVEGARVTAEIVGQGRARTVIAFKKRRRQNSRRKRGHRQYETTVRIAEILAAGAKPSRKKAVKEEAAEAAAPAEEIVDAAAAEATEAPVTEAPATETAAVETAAEAEKPKKKAAPKKAAAETEKE